uniref:Candidate secreted effector n=1 Tax=Meloidogyne incognita TaxID=6306 RepID=A0A914KT23_MELIC
MLALNFCYLLFKRDGLLSRSCCSVDCSLLTVPNSFRVRTRQLTFFFTQFLSNYCLFYSLFSNTENISTSLC